MLKTSINLFVILISFFNIGCSSNNYSSLDCPKLAHQYGLVNGGVKMCYEDEKKNPQVCNNRLYTNFSRKLDFYIAPYLQTMKKLDANYQNVYKSDIELFACGSFCMNLRAEIMRLYKSTGVNRYQSLKNYIEGLKRNYANSVGASFSTVPSNPNPIISSPTKKRLILKNIPQNCKEKYKLYLKEKRTKNRNLDLLNMVTSDLNSCINKERER